MLCKNGNDIDLGWQPHETQLWEQVGMGGTEKGISGDDVCPPVTPKSPLCCCCCWGRAVLAGQISSKADVSVLAMKLGKLENLP